jgi:predicted DNA-binding transcriptional regulator YafY
MYDPVMRVLAVLEILQARDSVSGAELAERLEVDLRTVQRYIVRLKDLNIPIDASRGVGGAYRLRPGFRLPPLLLTNEEAFALSLGLRALRQVGLSAFAPATEGTLTKLERVLPEALRESVRTVEDVVAIEPGPWVVSTSVESLIGAASAIRTEKRIRFDYRSHHDEATRRHIEPYAVMHTDGRWYLIGYCLSRKALRTFRLDRVSDLKVSTTGFRRPKGFDARRHMQESMPFVQSEHQIDVWIDMPLEEAERNFAPWRIATSAERGGTRLRCGRDRLELFAAMLLSMGRRIVVNQPAELRKTFRELGRRAADAARTGRPGTGRRKPG